MKESNNKKGSELIDIPPPPPKENDIPPPSTPRKNKNDLPPPKMCVIPPPNDNDIPPPLTPNRDYIPPPLTPPKMCVIPPPNENGIPPLLTPKESSHHMPREIDILSPKEGNTPQQQQQQQQQQQPSPPPYTIHKSMSGPYLKKRHNAHTPQEEGTVHATVGIVPPLRLNESASQSSSGLFLPPLSVIAQMPYAAHTVQRSCDDDDEEEKRGKSNKKKKDVRMRSHSEQDTLNACPFPHAITAATVSGSTPNIIVSPRPDDHTAKKDRKPKSSTPLVSPQSSPRPQKSSSSTTESPSLSMSKAGRILTKMFTKQRAATVADITITAESEEKEPPSFMTTFYTPALRESLTELLKKKYVLENAEFITDCEHFAEANFESNGAMAEEAQRIYNRYIAEGSPMEINISFKERKNLKDAVFIGPDQSIFEEISRTIRAVIETSFYLEWRATGAWKTIPFSQIKLQPPTMAQVIENRRLWNQLIRYVLQSPDGVVYANFYRKAEMLRKSPSVLGLEVLSSFYSEFFPEPTTDKQRDVVPQLNKAMKIFYGTLEKKYYPNWVLHRGWDCVFDTHITC